MVVCMCLGQASHQLCTLLHIWVQRILLWLLTIVVNLMTSLGLMVMCMILGIKSKVEEAKERNKQFEIQSIAVKGKLKELYGCNVYSLNPFINYNLEGVKYRSYNEINYSAFLTTSFHFSKK
jgi:hypothetical protein